MAVIAGIDGCPGGWLLISKDIATGQIISKILTRINDVISLDPRPDIITIDIPIGLTDSGPRECDLEARRQLGKPRSNSVFPAPIRPTLVAESYEQACQIGQNLDGRKLSKQTWSILPKIKEVDLFMRLDPLTQGWIREVHPEVCFWLWNGLSSMDYNKKKAEGRAERENLVVAHFRERYTAAKLSLRGGRYSYDDLLDAFAALWSAERIYTGRDMVLPPNPPEDSYGLRMEIVV